LPRKIFISVLLTSFEMRIEPLSSDSMGARSMATFIETGDLRILIDPGVALGPYRYGLPPHPIEWEKMERDWRTIVRYAGKADIIIITHYHYDHHNPWDDLEIFRNKTLIVKDPNNNINYSQRRRAHFFLNQIRGIPRRVEVAEGLKINIGETKLEISKAVFHGVDSKLGYVVEVYVEDGLESFLYSSDVEGPSLDDQLSFIIEKKPKVAMIDGPMTYMLGYRYSNKSLEASIRNLLRIVDINVNCIILDHHLLRDLTWRDKLAEVISRAESRGVKVLTSAEYAGKDLNMLEARRKELYETYPVKTSEMRRWSVED
jgi:predicted metallo-beta-lactamase superfamily hydrolase